MVALPQRELAIVVGVSVLACVLLSVVSWRPTPSPRALVAAGVVSGTFGTAAAVGGPPVALLYQHSDGPTLRATMGAFFLLGSVSSVAALAAAGEIGVEQLQASAVMVPFLVLGFVLSGQARRVLDGRWLRPAVLVVAATGAALVIVRSL